MKRVTSSLALVIGLCELSCGGQRPPASGPNASERADSTATSEHAESTANEGDNAIGSSQPEKPASPPTNSAESAPSEEAAKPSGDATPAHCRESTAKLSLAVDRASIDFERGTLEATMDGPICSVTMVITPTDGPKVELSFPYTTARRELHWTPLPRDRIEKMEIRVAAKNNAYQAITVVVWSVRIDHREVVFDTDKADIRRSEVPALEDSLAKIKQVLQTVRNKGFGTITLFVAGYTDTRGSAEKNLDLSKRRAQSIAGWFMKRGLCVPIAYDGFGETVLKKMTADEVDAQENRRADYILAVEPPAIAKGATPAWKWVSKGCH